MNDMTINFEVTTHCNQSCIYCKQHDNQIEMPSLEEYYQIIDLIFSLPRQIVSFCFYGGEPTVCPYLDKLIERVLIHNPEIELLMHSNLKKDVEYFLDLAEKFPSLKIAASFQIHQIKDTQKQVQKIIKLNNKGIILCCDFSLEYSDFKQNKKCFLELQKAGVLVKPMPIVYLKQSQRLLSKKINEFFYADIMQEDKYCEAPSETKDKICKAGYNYLFVRYNGDVWRCTTYKTRNIKDLMYGNLMLSYDSVVENMTKPKPCALTRCTCPTELNLA